MATVTIPAVGLVEARYAVSVALPERGMCGGFRRVAVEDYTVDARKLPEFAAGLGAWARAMLATESVPLGLYLAECLTGDDDPVTACCLRTEYFAWAEAAEWPLHPWVNPALMARVIQTKRM